MTATTPYIQVEMLPALQGDAILVRCVAAKGTTNILIDAGLASTYHDFVRPRLLELHAAGEDLAAFIITHIDADHIEGAIAFLADNGDSTTPAVIPVRDVWHNSYRHLPLVGRTPSRDEATRVLSQIPIVSLSAPGEISARHGSTLAAQITRLHYPWNHAFGGHAAVTESSQVRRINVQDNLRITLLSPTPPQLARLAREWRKELIMLGVPSTAGNSLDFELAFEAVLLQRPTEEGVDESTTISSTHLAEAPEPSTFREDRSITNASSLAFLLEFEGKSALLLGDGLPSVVLAQLQPLLGSAPHLAAGLVKVSHHGSKRNTSPALLDRLRSDHFLVSTDGSKHRHPDMEALLWIVASQPQGTCLHFNYATPESTAVAQQVLLNRYRHSVQVAVLGAPQVVVI